MAFLCCFLFDLGFWVSGILWVLFVCYFKGFDSRFLLYSLAVLCLLCIVTLGCFGGCVF